MVDGAVLAVDLLGLGLDPGGDVRGHLALAHVADHDPFIVQRFLGRLVDRGVELLPLFQLPHPQLPHQHVHRLGEVLGLD